MKRKSEYVQVGIERDRQADRQVGRQSLTGKQAKAQGGERGNGRRGRMEERRKEGGGGKNRQILLKIDFSGGGGYIPTFVFLP